MNTQSDIILDHLEHIGGITQAEAFEQYGIARLGARIWDLKRSGHSIMTTMEAGENRFGEPCRYARYFLIREAGQ